MSEPADLTTPESERDYWRSMYEAMRAAAKAGIAARATTNGSLSREWRSDERTADRAAVVDGAAG